MSNYAIQGWQCPICKAVMAPTTASCLHCKPLQQPTMCPISWPLGDIPISGTTVYPGSGKWVNSEEKK